MPVSDHPFITVAKLRALERLHFEAWPALDVVDVGGLKLRHSGGGSRRANSVSSAWCEPGQPIDYDRAFEKIEAHYAARGARPIVQTFDAGPLASLTAELQRRGYHEVDGTITMVKQLSPRPAATGIQQNAPQPTAEWLDVYLGAITEDRRLVNEQIIRSMTPRRQFFSCVHEGRTISTALGVIHDGQVVVECVATRADARRLGGAAAVLASLESWAVAEGAGILGLQVVVGNTAALALYERLGFKPADRNRYWMRG